MSPIRRTHRVAPAEFGALFRWITRASLASGMMACASDEEPPHVPALDGGSPIDAGGMGTVVDAGTAPIDGASADASAADAGDAAVGTYAPVPCTDGRVVLPAPLATTLPTDTLGIYTTSALQDPFLDRAYGAALLYGDPCAAAPQPDACAQNLSSVQLAAPCDTPDLPECDVIAIRGSGATLTRITSRADLLALFGGSVDSLAEAMLIAAFDVHPIVCPQVAATSTLSGTTYFSAPDGVHVQTEWEECGTGYFREQYVVATDGVISGAEREKIGDSLCAIGRRPSGLRGLAAADASLPVADHLRAASELEAASVIAFRELEAELAHLGAPAELVGAARDAAFDELKHTHVMAGLARRFGASPRAPVIRRAAPRSAFALARDNACEGCVRETYGALLATYQAAEARDRALREALSEIARDETRHAQLAWRIHAWLTTKLSDDERVAVSAARNEAVRALCDECACCSLDEPTRAVLGLPEPEVAQRLIGTLTQHLWS